MTLARQIRLNVASENHIVFRQSEKVLMALFLSDSPFDMSSGHVIGGWGIYKPLSAWLDTVNLYRIPHTAAALVMGSLYLDQDVNSDKYTLPRNETERERLELQHSFMTEALRGRLIVDNNVQLGPGCRVLDSGTGAASWLLALSKEVPETVELVGTDISSTMLPKEVPHNVRFYETSTTHLPADWENSFDLINQRLLMAAFTVPQWRAALSEMNRVLKPGGVVQLIEVGRYGCLHGSVTVPATAKADEIAFAVKSSRDLLGIECGNRLPILLEEIGFTDVQVELDRLPLGKQWGEIGVKGSKVYEVLFRSFGATLLAKGGLGVCSSRAEVDEIVDRAKQEWDQTPGIFRDMYAITARKST